MSPKKILFIEDGQVMVQTLGGHISNSGYEWSTVAQPSMIIPEITRIRPDLIILDLSIHSSDPFNILEILRTSPDSNLAHTLVIVASETGDIIEIGKALKFGVVDYFTKTNIDIKQVIAKIQKHIGVSTPEQQSSPMLQSTEPRMETSTLTQTGGGDHPQIKLLIVEDDKFLRDLAVQKLSKEDFQLYAAMDGEQGIAMAEKELPDVILLDILLPGIDGFEVLRRIRSNPALSNTSVAMLSNFGQREDVEKALGLGADQFFIKANYTLDEIVQEVKKIAASPREAK